MNTNEVTDLGTKWFDLLAVRNEAPYGSAKYNRAEKKMDEIENKASMIVFGDTKHTMCECLNGHADEEFTAE
jgi:hypothetical protein